MIYYLTYNEPYSGIFNSQVVDVVKHLRTEHQQEIRLISFVPIGFKMTYYKELSVKLRKAEPNCIIIPTVPTQYGWKFNWLLLYIVLFFHKRGSVFSREIFASYIALKCKKNRIIDKVCHDARGANLGQMLEYDVYTKKIKNEIFKIESFVVNNADFHLAVSQNLVRYWKTTFNYKSNNYVVIPCTIPESYIQELINEKEYKIRRIENGFTEHDIILVFSGSNYGWQSFDLIRQFCEVQLLNNINIKIVFLSKPDKVIIDLQQKFSNRVFIKWLEFDQVIKFLSICDYGILLRTSNTTNNVSSPTKFGEYLIAGLSVIVSDNLEFAYLVKKNNCGILVKNDTIENVNCKRISVLEKERIIDVAHQYFLKTSTINKFNYDKIIANLI